MADLTGIALRVMAREAIMRSGARGFVRFAQQGEMLLATDAIRRAEDGGAALMCALEEQGFVCSVHEGMLYITPQDEMVCALVNDIAVPAVDWESNLHPAQALAARWAAEVQRPFTSAGRQLVIDALRLTSQPGIKVTENLDALRARAAAMLRTGDRSGLREAGKILSQWSWKEERI